MDIRWKTVPTTFYMERIGGEFTMEATPSIQAKDLMCDLVNERNKEHKGDCKFPDEREQHLMSWIINEIYQIFPLEKNVSSHGIPKDILEKIEDPQNLDVLEGAKVKPERLEQMEGFQVGYDFDTLHFHFMWTNVYPQIEADFDSTYFYVSDMRVEIDEDFASTILHCMRTILTCHGKSLDGYKLHYEYDENGLKRDK